MTLIPSLSVRKPGGFRWFQVVVLVAATLVFALQPQSASAWFCRWRAAPCWYRPVCFQPFAYRPFCPPVYGYGFTGYRTFSYYSSYCSQIGRAHV